MGFQGMRKSTVLPNAQSRPPRATPASIARRRRPQHREFPTGYSLAGCSPAEPASASPAAPVYVHRPVRHNQLRCPHFLSPIGVHQLFAQPAHSLPQPRPIAPIFRDRTPSPGRKDSGRLRAYPGTNLVASEVISHFRGKRESRPPRRLPPVQARGKLWTPAFPRLSGNPADGQFVVPAKAGTQSLPLA
jgi:hypothetical protein